MSITKDALKSFNAEDIIDQCRLKFVNILPNTFNRQTDREKRSAGTEKLSSISNMYRRQEIKQVIHQLSVYLQLVIQNCVLTSDPKIRAECLRMLGNLRNLLSRDLDQFEGIISSRFKGRLPQYEVDCKPFIKRQFSLTIPPQISLYQDPLMFYIHSRFAQEELFCQHSIMMTRDERIQIIKNHVPFLNPLFIPIVEERLETKAKFSEMEDRLLLIIVMSPHKDSMKLRTIYFPNRPQYQIKNRIKNLCGNGRQMSNAIKQVKMNEYMPLREQEIKVLISAYSRFGSRWPVISRYYQLRTPEFLEAEYNQHERLLRRRTKENILTPYPSLKELIEEGVAQIKKKNKVEVEIDEEKDIEESKKSDTESVQEMEQEPRYKIINHLTFMVEEI